MLQLRGARVGCIGRWPYLGSALMALTFVESRGVPSIGVDQSYRCYYNPEWVGSQQREQLEGFLYHEISHILRKHGQRMHGADPRLSNLAGDCEINDDLEDERVQLPADGVYPRTFKFPEHLTAEDYLQRLIEKANKIKVIGWSCGSGATGRGREWELPEDGDIPGISEIERSIIEKQVAESIAKRRGRVPGHWQRWAEERLVSTVDWRTVLSAQIRRSLGDVSGAVDYSYARLSRRQSISPCIILPSLRRPTINAAIVADTSGSIDAVGLAKVKAETEMILKSVGVPSVHFLAVDAEVHVSKRISTVSQAELRGGGGTDMGVGIAAALTLKPRPEVIVVITDCYTPWPVQAPPCKVVVARMGEGGQVPPWARLVQVRK